MSTAGTITQELVRSAAPNAAALANAQKICSRSEFLTCIKLKMKR